MLEISSSLRDLFTQKTHSLDSLHTLSRRAVHSAPVVEILAKGLNNRVNLLGPTLVLLTLLFPDRKVVFATTCNFLHKVFTLA
jgi:hypothetical protein